MSMKDRRQRSVRWERNKVTLTTTSANYLERYSRPQPSKGEPRWSLTDSLSRGGKVDITERSGLLEFVEHSTRELRTTKIENSRNLQKISLKNSAKC